MITRDIKITKGYAFKGNKPIVKGSELLNASCFCGIDCCYGAIILKQYNSISGDEEIYWAYLVDGAWVIEDAETAKTNITAIKAGPQNATARINDETFGLVDFYYNFNDSGGFTHATSVFSGGNQYTITLASGEGYTALRSIRVNSTGPTVEESLPITITNIVSSTGTQYTLYNPSGPAALTLPQTTTGNEFTIAAVGTNSPYQSISYPDSLEITFIYNGLIYKLIINTVS